MAAVPSLLALFLLAGGFPLAGMLAGSAALSAALFFRDPERSFSAGPGEVLSPADGRVVAVDTGEESRHLGGQALRISVFMSVFNVHINRIPMDGLVRAVKHVPGGFAMAHLDDAGIINERTEILIEDTDGRKNLVVQVAGLVARRIICRLAVGDKVERGQRFGLICFGSRVDLYLSGPAAPLVKIGDKVRAGQSVLAIRT